MVNNKSGLTIGIIALAISFSSLSANDLPKEEEEGMVLESVFIENTGEKATDGSAQAEDAQGGGSPSSSLLIDVETAGKTKGKPHSKSHLDGKLSLGKGEKLSDEEINLSLLVFAKEEEAKKKKLLEEEEAKKEQEDNLAKQMIEAPQLSAITPSTVGVLTIEEQKDRISAGLSQFPELPPVLMEGEHSVEKIVKEIIPPIDFYGVSCVDNTCVALGANGSYKVGDILSGDEKVLSISKKRIKTTTREVAFNAENALVDTTPVIVEE